MQTDPNAQLAPKSPKKTDSLDSTLSDIFLQTSLIVQDNAQGDKKTSGVRNQNTPPLISLDAPQKQYTPAELTFLAAQISLKSQDLGVQAGNAVRTINKDRQVSEMKKNAEAAKNASETQTKSDKKSGIMGIFNKIFTGLSLVVGAVLVATGVGAAAGAALIAGAVVSLIMQSGPVADLIGKMMTALQDKLGPIAGAIVGALIVTAVAIAASAAGGAGLSALGSVAVKAAQGVVAGVQAGTQTAGAVVRTLATAVNYLANVAKTAGVAMQQNIKIAMLILQSATQMAQGGMGIGLGITQIDLADIKKAFDLSAANLSEINGLLKQLTATMNQTIAQMISTLQASINMMASFGQVIPRMTTA